MKFLTLIAAFIMFSVGSAAAQIASSESLCKVLRNHKPGAGVTYQPGVDVHGKPVVPADAGAPLGAAFDYYEIPIEMDLVQKFNLDVPEGVELKPVVGGLRVYKDGRVSYNGQDVTSQSYAICEGGGVPPVASPEVSGQSESDGLSSARAKKGGSQFEDLDGIYPPADAQDIK